MDDGADDIEMLSTQRRGNVGSVLDARWGDWVAREMVMDYDKIKWFWDTIQAHRALFSDLTRGNVENFANLILANSTFWIEVVEINTGKIIGVMYVTDIQQMIDASVHIIFFDRKPKAKSTLCRMVLEWLFHEFSFRRLSAYIPATYWVTLGLARQVGFVEEGRRRQALLLNSRWVDEIVLGILRSEVINGRND